MTTPPTTKSEILAPIRRWTWLRKFWLCHGIQKGIVTVDEVMQAHQISSDELNGWYAIYRRDGANGFRRRSPNPRRYAA